MPDSRQSDTRELDYISPNRATKSMPGGRYWCLFKFYKHVNDDPDFAKTLLDLLFERYLGRAKK